MVSIAGIFSDNSRIYFYPVNTEEKHDPKDLPNCVRDYETRAQNFHAIQKTSHTIHTYHSFTQKALLSKLFLIKNYLEKVSDAQWEDLSVDTYIQGIIASKVCYFVELVKLYEEQVEAERALANTL